MTNEQEKIDEAFKRGYELGKKVQAEKIRELIEKYEISGDLNNGRNLIINRSVGRANNSDGVWRK